MTSIEPTPAALLAPPTHRQAVSADALHRAVVRDLRRLVAVLPDPITAVRRQALVTHIGFILDRLAEQHHLLDQFIWPAAERHRQDLADVGQRVRRSHAELAGPADRLRQATLEWSRAALQRGGVLSAVRDLAARLEPAIDRDAELMPLALASLGPADRVEIDRRIPRPGGPTRLARRTFWLLDELEPERAALLQAGRPGWARWILRNGFSGAYNRSSYLMWVGGGTGPAV